ncbi:hypothetical protein U3A58_00335 [Algoriphagus sp. C2-6-M1]|uniref:hypothetical protein n=1 Tax=Algoriphagus persicinus TaxID=3108754 RepID=UPI002B3C2464|nr:hypothetical protein [Algoriphagus sp. C2-6-M1]MEB2778823.1 hypothetical protein [Algoriphagus sp. C2-6-M1]
MKKVNLGIGLFALSLAFFIPQNAMTEEEIRECFEAYYPATFCPTQGFDNCVNQICPPPEPVPCEDGEICPPSNKVR